MGQNNDAPRIKLDDNQILVKNVSSEYLVDMKVSCYACDVDGANRSNLFEFYVL